MPSGYHLNAHFVFIAMLAKVDQPAFDKTDKQTYT